MFTRPGTQVTDSRSEMEDRKRAISGQTSNRTPIIPQTSVQKFCLDAEFRFFFFPNFQQTTWTPAPFCPDLFQTSRLSPLRQVMIAYFRNSNMVICPDFPTEIWVLDPKFCLTFDQTFLGITGGPLIARCPQRTSGLIFLSTAYIRRKSASRDPATTGISYLRFNHRRRRFCCTGNLLLL